MTAIWAGIDAGKAHHHCVVIDQDGKQLLSRRVLNDEQALLNLIGDVHGIGDQVVWGIDLVDGGAALLVDLLLAHGQQVRYIPGIAVNRASDGYQGEAKTDAKDAAIIADQVRIRRNLQTLRPGDELVTELKILTRHRRDLADDRTRVINRLRGHLTAIFPALERVLDLTNIGPLVLLTGYQSPAAIRGVGLRRLHTWLNKRKVRNSAELAAAAVAAADSQMVSVSGEKPTAELICHLAEEVMRLNRQIAEFDKRIEARFREHEHAEVITSMPGIGTLLGAEFVAATGGDMAVFGSPDRLAGFAGVAPRARDSGRISDNMHRPKRYSRTLQRVMYTSALISIRSCEESRRFYDRKRAEGKRHIQAVLALARRRVNVLWALLRDGRCYHQTPPVIAAA